MKPIFALLVVAAPIALAGCQTPAPKTATAAPANNPAPSAPASPTAAATPKGKPAWATETLNVFALLGKSKDDVVAKMGVPKLRGTGTVMGGASTFYRYAVGDAPVERALFGGSGGKEHELDYYEFDFDGTGRVAQIIRQVRYDDRKKTPEVWAAFDDSGKRPPYFFADSGEVAQLIKSPDTFRKNPKPGDGDEATVLQFPLTIVGKTSGGVIVTMRANAEGVPLKAGQSFNTTTERVELGKPVAHPDYVPDNDRVYQIVGTRKRLTEGDSPYPFAWTEKLPVATTPKPVVVVVAPRAAPTPRIVYVTRPVRRDPPPQVSGESYTGEHFPETRTRYLSSADISDWDYASLRYAVNEIYARHGFVFKTKTISNQFKQFSWYYPDASVNQRGIEARLSSVEKANLVLLTRMRNSIQAGDAGGD